MANETSSQASASAQPVSLWRRWVLDFHNRTVLFRIGNWIFTTYAFLAAAAFATGFSVSLWYSAMIGLDAIYIAKLYLFIIVPMVLVGLRSFSIMLEWRELFRHPIQTLIKPGYMLHGGILGGVVGMATISWMAGIPVMKLLDGPSLAMPLGEAIARLGCYVYGCCWGRPTTSWWGVRYTSPESKVVRFAPHLQNVKIHPAQLYALVIYLGMFVVFYAALPYVPFDGFLSGCYLIGHSVVRYSLEFFRQDDRGKLWGKFTHTNLYSAAMVFGGVFCLVVGAMGGSPINPDMSVRLTHVVGDPAIFPWVAMYGLVFGFAYGVHYGKVGSWLTKPSGGMKPNVDELSMGAVARMEAKKRQD